jgi:ParB-like chromosome segregation protein Spo0J
MELAKIENYKLIPLKQLCHADWNYKADGEEMTEKLIANMKRNGQVENLIVRQLSDDMYEVVNGNHRMTALTRIGCQSAVCYDLGAISIEEAYRISIETNETRFVTDQVKLSDLLKAMNDKFTIDDLLSTLPYNHEELNNLIKLSDFNWDEYAKEPEPKPTDAKDESEEPIYFKLTIAERERWDAWCNRMKDITLGDWKESLLVALSVVEQLTDEDIESALVK